MIETGIILGTSAVIVYLFVNASKKALIAKHKKEICILEERNYLNIHANENTISMLYKENERLRGEIEVLLFKNLSK